MSFEISEVVLTDKSTGYAVKNGDELVAIFKLLENADLYLKFMEEACSKAIDDMLSLDSEELQSST